MRINPGDTVYLKAAPHRCGVVLGFGQLLTDPPIPVVEIRAPDGWEYTWRMDEIARAVPSVYTYSASTAAIS